jgi:RNA polymerase sigma factor (sigma-70 family)
MKFSLSKLYASSPQEDRILWRDFKNGSEEALEHIFKTYYPLLYDYGIRLIGDIEMVKDGIQDLFVYLWEKRENLGDVKSIKAYLMVSFRRLLLSKKDACSRHRQELNHYLGELRGAQMPSFDDILVLREIEEQRLARLQQALEKIPRRMKEALYLRVFQELSYAEIAEILNVRPQVIRNYVCQALKKLKKFCQAE